MLLFKSKEIGIDHILESLEISKQYVKENLLIIQNLFKILKNSESKRDLKVKKNINVYIPLQIIISSRGYL